MLLICRFLFLLSFILLTTVLIQAQITAETRNGQPRQEEVPQNIQETLAKRRIELEKKDHDELIERGQEALKLSEQLENSYNKNQKLSKVDFERLAALEKLLKKIRKELGGSDDDNDTEEEKPLNLGDAVKYLRENTISLVDYLQKTTRYSISVTAIATSNTVLRIVKFMRFWKN